MKRSTARNFWSDVEEALDDYFEDDNCFWDTNTYMDSDDGTDGATIEIEIDYDEVPEYYDDIFCEVENAVSNCGWDYSADWNGNTYEVTHWD